MGAGAVALDLEAKVLDETALSFTGFFADEEGAEETGGVLILRDVHAETFVSGFGRAYSEASSVRTSDGEGLETVVGGESACD